MAGREGPSAVLRSGNVSRNLVASLVTPGALPWREGGRVEDSLLGAEQFAEVRIVVGLTVPFAGAAGAGNYMQMDLGVEVHEEGVVVGDYGHSPS
jgi:hypothetical protein